ncbi:MAG: rhodanese-like domain-containing protein [Mariprofundaceae bacterium]
MGFSRSLRHSGVLIVLLCMPWVADAEGMTKPTATIYEKTSVTQAYIAWKDTGNVSQAVTFLDVRTVEEYASGHIPGAVNIPIQSLARQMKNIPEQGVVYVYCEAGGRAARASAMLVGAGFGNIKLVPESMRGWRAAHYPVEK